MATRSRERERPRILLLIGPDLARDLGLFLAQDFYPLFLLMAKFTKLCLLFRFLLHLEGKELWRKIKRLVIFNFFVVV